MTVQASNNQPVLNPSAALDVSAGRANDADRTALDAQSRAAVSQYFGDMLPPAPTSELKPSAEYTAGVVSAVDAPIKFDAAEFVLARLAQGGLDTSPVIADLRRQYSAEPAATRLAA